MRVLVTGGQGRVGRSTASALVRRGHEVMVVDRDETRAPVDGVELRIADLLDPEQVERAMIGSDAVVHLAGIPHPTDDAPWRSFETNVMTSFIALRIAAQVGGPRVVLASSASVIGLAWAKRQRSPRYVPIDDSHPREAADHYALAKHVTEVSAESYVRETGNSAFVMRFPKTPVSHELVAHVRDVAADPSDATSLRDLWSYIHVDDIGESFADAVETDVGGYHRLTVVAPDTLSLRPTEELLAEYYPDVPLTRPIPDREPAWDMTVARDVLGRLPSTSWMSLPEFAESRSLQQELIA